MATDIDAVSKGLLGAFAFFVLGSGIGTLIYGVLLLLRYVAIQYNYGAFNLFLGSIFLIVISGLLMITVFLGTYGVLKDQTNIRLVTLILAMIIFLVLVLIGSWAMYLVQSGRLKQSIDAEFDALNGSSKDLTGEKKSKVDYLNQHYHCCNAKDASSGDNANYDFPDNCCKSPGCTGSGLMSEDKYYEKGCREIFAPIKTNDVWRFSLLTLVAGGTTLLALILYAVIYQRRAHAGYAGVSRG